ncbi:hypothetical protein WSK_1584 [Novosphingobium sp. Rr 2-17]|uniref:hypothetical protein n=1 Tax=Novosphingobium sp. Rr 2-17 TaxID=555793 RepID=UPI000269985B|nr:hypothetical protein [Novosphingobium sp. Rr 2-17]EIZ79803.1 hypothetical protein WSK_1584 [Novosphingobium sp. Rr 2-17]
MLNRRQLIASSLVAAAASPSLARAAERRTPLDRAAYDRYVTLFNAEDPRFTDLYADDVQFLMGIKGKSGVLAFYGRQRPYVKETLEVEFFCSDAGGAAAEVRGTMRCYNDCSDPSIFGQPVKAGQVQVMHGYLLYLLDARGKIAVIKGSRPEVLQPWDSSLR